MKDQNKIYDQERIRAENLMEPIYRYDPEKGYTLHVGYDYLPQDDLMCHEFWKIWRAKMEGIREDILSGKSKKSPLYYFMEKNFMEPFAFSKFLGISFWRLRRHLKAKGFSRLDPDKVKLYADALDITQEELLTMK